MRSIEKCPYNVAKIIKAQMFAFFIQIPIKCILSGIFNYFFRREGGWEGVYSQTPKSYKNKLMLIKGSFVDLFRLNSSNKYCKNAVAEIFLNPIFDRKWNSSIVYIL